jgi:hypothetical protein
MNEFIILLENAAAIGWFVLCAVAAAAVTMLIVDRKPSRSARSESADRERMAA